MKVPNTSSGSYVSPILDTTRKIFIPSVKTGEHHEQEKTMLEKNSAEDLCSFISREDISSTVSGSIKVKYYQFLIWKNINVLANIIGPYQVILDLFTSARKGTNHND